jgi:AraC-like DNA-binding protein
MHLENTSFSEYVRTSRLDLSHRLLCEHAMAHRTIANLAYDAGFGDLSYFNRAFREAFGATPGDVRRQAGETVPVIAPEA